MLSSFIYAKPRRTTLIFPNEQKLWTFFALAEISEFRIESSKHAFVGKLHSNDIELAKQKLGAYELKEETAPINCCSRTSHFRFSFAQLPYFTQHI